MPRHLVRLLSLIIVCMLMAGHAAAYTLNSKEGRFTAVFPAEPKFTKENLKTSAGYFVDQFQWLLDQDAVAWLVIYGDYPAAEVKRLGSETMYDNGMRGSVEAVKGTMIRSESINHSGVRGRDSLVDIPADKMILRQRLFVVGSRLYQNIYVGPSGSERDANVEAFLNAFQMRK